MLYFLKCQCAILFHCSFQPLNNIEIKRENSVKFLGVIIDENLTWKSHIEVVENKISKYIGVLYRVSHLPDFKNLLKLYFSFIRIYISYASIAWASTFKIKLQGILKKQKHAAQINLHANRFDYLRSLLKEIYIKSFKCLSNQFNSNSNLCT